MAGINLKVDWSPSSQRFFDHFQIGFTSMWQEYMDELSDRFAEYGTESIKPNLVGKSKFYTGGHNLEKSLEEVIVRHSDGFEIQWEALWYGKYMDVGNFPAQSIIMRSNGKPFPVGLNRDPEGDVTRVMAIHGMGHTTKGVPTHFSDKTVSGASNTFSLLVRDATDKFIKSVAKI